MRKKTGNSIRILLLIALTALLVFSCSTTDGKQKTKENVKKENNDPNVVTKSKVSRHNGYTYEFWNQDNIGNATMTLQEGSTFDIKWSGIFNMLARIGIRPGYANTKVTYNADVYSINRGLSYLCVYGWTYNKEARDNLVEFYIVENWKNYRPPGSAGTLKGTVTVDGDEYDIYTSLRMEQPSIFGTRTFYQYWSVRKKGQERTSGTIDVAAHFNAWKELGMEFGDTLYEVSFCVEGFEGQKNGAGSASISELTFETEE